MSIHLNPTRLGVAEDNTDNMHTQLEEHKELVVAEDWVVGEIGIRRSWTSIWIAIAIGGWHLRQSR